MTDPVDDFKDYDSFKLAGVRSPGVCTFPTAPERIEGWEQQVPSGGGGGFTVHKRTPPIEWDVEIYVWVGEDESGAPVNGFADYEKFKKLFKVTLPKGNPNSVFKDTTPPKALAWSHPLTDKLDPPVASVVIGKWGMPKPDGFGGGTARIHVEEFRPLVIRPVTGPKSTYEEKKDPRIAAAEEKLHAKRQTLDAVRGPRT